MTDDQIDSIDDLFGGVIVLDLTDQDLVALQQRGLGDPFQPRHLDAAMVVSPETFDGLIERGLLEADGEPSEGVRVLWKNICPVPLIFLVEAETLAGLYVWVYSVGPTGYAELTQGPGGSTFLVGTTDQLLGRVLLTAGVAWHSIHPDLAGADPLPHEARTKTRISRLVEGGQVEELSINFLDFGCLLSIDGQSVDAGVCVESVAGLLSLVE